MKYYQIPQSALIPGRWYLGRGRNSNIGFWTGKTFIVLGINYNSWDIKSEPYYTSKGGCFQPFLLLDEGKIVSYGNAGWSKHYGKELIIDETTQRDKNTSWTSRDKHEFDIEELKKPQGDGRGCPGA